MTYLAISEFQDAGYLQEVNRQFFHPLGLALEVVIEEDGSRSLGGIWDYRDDPEGMTFAPEVLASRQARERAARVAEERKLKALVRAVQFEWVVQPIPEDTK